MRRLALLGFALTLSGCGYQTWWNPPFTSGYNPNKPLATSENLQRVEGGVTNVTPITTEPGDIWPGPLAPPPTLQDLEHTGGLTPAPEQAVPGSPLSRGTAPPVPSPNPSTGSSTNPGNQQPGLSLPNPPPATSYATPPTPAQQDQTGRVIQTPSGPNVITGGTNNYQTTTTPGGGQSIVVPNGNGTSTVIHSDGRVETIPSPK